MYTYHYAGHCKELLIVLHPYNHRGFMRERSSILTCSSSLHNALIAEHGQYVLFGTAYNMFI